MDPIKFSSKTHQEATIILDQTKIIDLLSQLGDARIGGSYYTDLMYGPDIDITVATNSPRKSAIKFLSQIINKRSFQKYQYGDCENFPIKKRPKGHIVVLILPFNDRRWEIEIWFAKKHFKDQIKLEEKLKQLSPGTKAKIVRLKAKREKLGLNKHSQSSFDIYKDFV
jgi:hypothetical protein